MPFDPVCCPFCGTEDESPIHSLLQCSFPWQVWALSGLHWSDIDALVPSVEEWFKSLTLKLSPPLFNLFAMICWTIWWSRNLKCAGKEFLTPLQVVDFARSYLLAFSSQGQDCASVESGNIAHWIPPPAGFVKINFDGGIRDGGRVLGLGVVARDADGRVLDWISRRVDRGGSTFLAESLAAREALYLAIRRQWHQVFLEGDCSSLFQKLSSSLPDYSFSSPIVEDSRFFASQIDHISYSLVRRSCNSAADLLAKLACNQEGDFSSVPPSLVYVLSGDLAV
ncbi:UNVERIFIED_CONTAM: hypothetical protein Sradi_4323500 [Sesamum radiatum]|uniref:RNase H type-1 domain-containing protein n=1 Tax=Sesamum radiatum TaxID=300843 RepID=A0AAW2NPT4_SESRA